MDSNFRSSFGGDGGIEEALELWKKQPDYLKNLARVTSQNCVYLYGNYIECPREAGTGFRAGFKETNGRWRMEYFLAGD